jgi:glycolate oxidase FAD binding subunit
MAEPLTPTDRDALCDVVRAALAEERPLELIGGGSKRALGRPVDGVPVSLDALSGVLFYEPEELVMSARAGTPLAVVEQELAGARQQLAFEPADYGRLLGGPAGGGTIGGVFACNLSGPRRLKAGAARDHLLGIEAVTGRGDAIRSGGRVVKNVTGYDLSKLLTGSFGTLAAMTEVTFKTLPAPEETRTLVVAGASEPGLLAALRAAMGTPYEVAGAALLTPPAAARSSVQEVAGARQALAALRLEGHGPSVAYRAEALGRELASRGDIAFLDAAASRALWREIRDVALLPPDRTLWRLSVPPTEAAAYVTHLRERLDLEVLYDWAGGLIWLAVDAPGAGAEAVRGMLPAGAHATLIRADSGLRSRVPVFQPQPDALAALTARVKDSFDPSRVLNRGRMYEGL